MLLVTERHTRSDLAFWGICEREDATHARRLAPRRDRMIAAARDAMLAFIRAEGGEGYLGVSWGKDSVICAWLLSELEREHGVSFPVVWVRLTTWQNPDSYLVRDAFLRRWPLSQYSEIVAEMGETLSGRKEERLVAGFREASSRYGDRYISGVRADESGIRRMSIGHHGIATARVCRPIGTWTTTDVYAMTHNIGLPLHPAYGYTMGGLYDRSRLRVANIGGIRGAGYGRRGWEEIYYPDVWRAAEAAGEQP